MIENVQQLLTEQLGKNGSTEVFTTAAQSGKDWYCVYFPVESVVASIVAADATGEAAFAGGGSSINQSFGYLKENPSKSFL